MNTDSNKPSFLKWFFIYVFPPLAIVAVAGILVGAAFYFKPAPEKKDPVKRLPSVEVFQLSAKPIQLSVESQGAVQPRTETTLVAEVGGRVTHISPALYAGGRFSKGDVLAKIDPIDYEAALATAQARLADAEVVLDQERALAEQAIADWRSINDREATDLALRKPQLKRARANHQSAEAAVKVAKRDLDRTAVRAPYDGLSREKLIDIGQITIPRSTAIGRIYGTEIAEVRLPISLDQLAYLPVEYGSDMSLLSVELSARYAGKEGKWLARVDRIEGAVDQRTRLAHIVAQVIEPYRQIGDHTPLPVGLFVKAKIEGEYIDQAFEIPRKALKRENAVYILDTENKIEIRSVDVYHSSETKVVILNGLHDGERICLTDLEYAVNGMEVAVKE